MSDQDAEFDAWLSKGDAAMLESLDAVVDTEENLTQLRHAAAKRAFTVAQAKGSDEPDRAIRSVLASEVAGAANEDEPRPFVFGAKVAASPGFEGRLRIDQGVIRWKRRRLLTFSVVHLLLVGTLSASVVVLVVGFGHGHPVTRGDRMGVAASLLSALSGLLAATVGTGLALAMASRRRRQRARLQAKLVKDAAELTQLSSTRC